MQDSSTSRTFQRKGYFVLRNQFETAEVERLRSSLITFHKAWIKDNQAFFNSKAINSAYLTGPKYLSSVDRLHLFNFIVQDKVVNTVAPLFPEGPAFMNTQLFFNPQKTTQPNYWHRDTQYSGLSVEEQIKTIQSSNVIHVRIPLHPELGLELIPGTHKRWDTQQEFATRMEQGEAKSHGPLPNSKSIPLEPGDMLVFSAHMIHRGLYGLDRFALDILFCDPTKELLQFVSPDCLPDKNMLEKISNPKPFKASLNLTNSA